MALAGLTLPYLPLLAWQARNWLLPPGEATLFQIRSLDVMLESTFDGWGGNFVEEPWATLILGALALLALVYLAALWLLQQDRKTATCASADLRPAPAWGTPLSLLTWILLPLLGVWLISLRQPIFTNRYLVWAAPAFYLLAAGGLITLWRQGRGGRLAAVGLALVLIVGDGRALIHQATRSIKPDFRAAANYVRGHYAPGDLILFHLSYIEQNFAYYYGDDYSGRGAPAAGNEMSEQDIGFYIQTQTNGYDRVWLVQSESNMWDPRGLVKGWMDSHSAGPALQKSFPHIDVYQYRLEPRATEEGSG
jgi:mannosyltransferase